MGFRLMTNKSLLKLDTTTKVDFDRNIAYIFSINGSRLQSRLVHNFSISTVNQYGEYHYLPLENIGMGIRHFENKL